MADDKEKKEKEEKLAAEKKAKKERGALAAAENAKAKAAGEKKSKADRDSDKPTVEAVYPRLRTFYKEKVAPELMKELGFKSVMQVPRITKIVINCGLGRSTQNIKVIDQALKDVAAIAGQKPVATKSKVAISNFKLRAGLPIGVMVTLRGNQMYEFLDRLLSLALPRIRDFRGISDKGFDGAGNYTLGLKDQLVFPEVQYDTLDASFGMNITFVTTAKNDKEGRALLDKYSFPFRKRQTTQKAA
ncbi:MAG: 50S ribosomal protein L5 [Deltaproteobacteria bacterium]|nr:50S ribosomal protein L5 [Deltaproteobacteria bacterium]